jgi:hypothetical protein
MLLAAGAYLAAYGIVQIHRGVFVYANASYHQTTFAAGTIGMGLFMAALSALPSSNWVYKSITTRRELRKQRSRRKISIKNKQSSQNFIKGRQA